MKVVDYSTIDNRLFNQELFALLPDEGMELNMEVRYKRYTKSLD